MSREVRRVPLDFDWPLNKVWEGYLTPEPLREKDCGICDGTGYSGYARLMQNRWYGYVSFNPEETGSTRLTPETPAVRAFAERNVARSPEYYGASESAIRREAERLCGLWNAQLSHHLHQDDVDALVADGRLHDLTHTWKKGEGWQPIEPAPTVTAEQVNTWSLAGFGHDSINCWVVVRAKCQRDGQPETCDGCGGHGSLERYEGQRAEAEAWTAPEPPTGEGWQLWETTSEGSPITPVFDSAEGLARWMSEHPVGFAKSTITYEAALRWVTEDGWAPSMVGTPEAGLQDGITFMASRDGAS